MIKLKTQEDIECIREAAQLVGKTIAEVGRHIQPGVTTAFLDKIAEQYIYDNGASAPCKGYEGYPAATCIAVNDVVVHGIPNDSLYLHDGDEVSVDIVVKLNGYYADSCYTFACGEVDPKVLRLLRTTKECLYLGIEQARPGNRLGDIGHAVQAHAEKNGYGVVRELCGHGVGFDLHESPSVVNYGVRGTGVLLKEGMVICIEPMVTMGSKNVKFSKEDGWTVRTKDGKPAAHYEHTIAITTNGPEILSTFDFIDANRRIV